MNRQPWGIRQHALRGEPPMDAIHLKAVGRVEAAARFVVLRLAVVAQQGKPLTSTDRVPRHALD